MNKNKSCSNYHAKTDFSGCLACENARLNKALALSEKKLNVMTEFLLQHPSTISKSIRYYVDGKEVSFNELLDKRTEVG